MDDASSKRTKKSSAKQPKASFGVNPAVISLFSLPPPPPTQNSAPDAPDVKDGAIKKRKRNEKKIKPIHVKSNAPKSLEEEYESKQAQMQADEERKSKKEKGANGEDVQETKKKKKAKSTDDGAAKEPVPSNISEENAAETDKPKAKGIKKKPKEKAPKVEMDDEKKKECTVFVGNVPVTTNRKQLKQIFKKYGPLHSIRFRSVAFDTPMNTSEEKKGAFMGKRFHPGRETCNVYVVFTEKDHALKSLEANNTVLKNEAGNEFHLSVDLAEVPTWNMARSVFVGNMPFTAQDEELRKHFESCGTVKRIRIVRDKDTFIGKGFGFVEFVDRDSVSAALEMQDNDFKGRKLRVSKASKQQQPQRSNDRGKKTVTTRDNKPGKTNTSFQGMQALQGVKPGPGRKRKRNDVVPGKKNKGKKSDKGAAKKKAKSH